MENQEPKYYYRLCKGLNAVGKFYSSTDDPYKHITDLDSDWYISINRYSENQYQEAIKEITATKKEKNGSILEYKRLQGVKGVVDTFCKHLVFDLDNTNDLEQARKDTIKVFDQLVELGVPSDKIEITFSGGKGFGLVVPHRTEMSPEQHREIALGIADSVNVKIDTSLYDHSQILRVPFTKHQKTGLYKTPLSENWLKNKDINFIKQQSEKKQKPFYKPQRIDLPENLLKIKPKEIKKEVTELDLALGDKELPKIDFSKKPFYLSDAKYALHQGYIEHGCSNEAFMILCSTYRNSGFDKRDAYHMLKSVNEKRAEVMGVDKKPTDEIWQNVVSTVYSSAWRGGMYSEKENELLKNIVQKFSIKEKSNMVTIGSVTDRFFEFAESINENIIRTGIKTLDENLMMTTGMMVGILGAPSSGKTNLATKILETTISEGQKALFLSLDMHDNLLFMRFLQRQIGINIQKLLRKTIKTDPLYDPKYNFKNDLLVKQGIDKLHKVYENASFDFTRGCTIESIEENLKKSKQENGNQLKLVVIDYLEKVRGPYTDVNANVGYIASRISDLASTYDVCILLLLQPQKSAGDPSQELVSMRAVKGASAIEQDSRVILTLWRPGFSPKDPANDKYASVAIVKNNMGDLIQLDYGWDSLKGQLTELSRDEIQSLENLRNAIKEEKMKDSKEDW